MPGVSATSDGDLEIGALYIPHFFDLYGITFVVRAGLTLPSGSTAINEELAAAYVSIARLSDYYLSAPDATSLRFAVSPLWHRGWFFARADVGADFNISADSDATVGNAFRLDAGVGATLGMFSLTLESTNMYSNGVNNNFSSSTAKWYDTGAIAARLSSNLGDVYAALVLPVDHETHDVLGDMATFNAAITLGVEGRL
jgi:hypothetical protein